MEEMQKNMKWNVDDGKLNVHHKYEYLLPRVLL